MDLEILIQKAAVQIWDYYRQNHRFQSNFIVEDILRDVLEPVGKELKELKYDLHLANGCADLAMKHRDEAEAKLNPSCD